MTDLYRAAVKLLPGWGDEEIMECDLGRLQIAIDAAREQTESDWRQRYRIGGFKLDDQVPEPETDEDFNDQVRATMAMFRKAD